METKHHWFIGLVVAVLVVAAFIQGSMLSSLSQRVNKLEGNMASMSSQSSMTPGSSMEPSTPPTPTNPSTQTNGMTNRMNPTNQTQPPNNEEY